MIDRGRQLLRACGAGALGLTVLAATAAPAAAPAYAATAAAAPATQAAVGASVHNDVSAPLASLGDTGTAAGFTGRHAPFRLPRPAASRSAAPSASSAASIPATSLSFDGVGQGFTGPQGTFSVQAAPPDTNGAVGPNNFFEIVNTSFAIFDKTGTAKLGPTAVNTLWSGFGGLCQTNNDGDPVVRYDRLADRWVVLQLAVTNANGTSTPFLICVAVSTTGDPTGSYNRYSFAFANFPDYPKLSVWPDAYYLTINQFNAAGTQFLGGEVSALNRASMLAGQPASSVSFTTANTIGGLLPSDLDSGTAPPSGAPNHVLALGANANTLAAFNFHVDFATPGNSTFAGPTNLATAAFTEPCNGGGTCIRQSNTRTQLDSLGDRLMFRNAYRNFGDHESMVVAHTVTAGSSTGIRWYELRISSGTPAIFQQGTFAPDSSFRWMPSIAMDNVGDIAAGFSVSSSSSHPGIRYAGRLAGDAAGTFGQGEATIITGGGSQNGNLTRWGDYTSMTVDPVDNCTFWYTNEYLASNGSFNWKTRIASFKFPGCR